MIAGIASAALLVAASLIVGRCVLALCGSRESAWVAGPVGLAALLVVGGLVAGWGGRGVAIAIAIGATLAVALLALAFLSRRAGLPSIRRSTCFSTRSGAVAGVGAALLAALFAAIPFIAAGQVGILGVGLVNDDMASHLLLADWIDERFRPEPVLIDQGYPLGPHGLVAGLSELLGARSIDVFAGLIVAIPSLTALTAYSVLERLGPARVGASALVALPYMAVAYLAQEAFKEPMIALFLLAFALWLPAVRTPRQAIPLGVLAAGTVYVYSFPGLAWLGGVGVVWGAIELLRDRREERSVGMFDVSLRGPLIAVGVGVLTMVVLVAPEAGRLVDFADFRALDPDRANEGGLGNLRGQISPLEAFGVWPTGEFRLSAGASSLPAIAFYAGALLAAAAFVAALPGWVRRHGPAIPAALITAVALYIGARAFGTVYTSAKALAISAPLIALVTLGGLLASDSRVLRALGAAFAVAAAASSFLVLRQAPVAPEEHMEQLAEIRPLVEGEKLLFLGRDNFVLHSLRGSKPFTAVRNFYVPDYVKPNLELEQPFAKFDFDSVRIEDLARFRYVLTTKATYASGAPPEYAEIAGTDDYTLWERREPPGGRFPGETGPDPGRVGGCRQTSPEPTVVATFAEVPVVSAGWSQATIEDGEPARVTLELPRGSWELSLQYDSTRPLELSAPGYEHELPGNLDYRGSVPFWPAGRLDSAGGAPIEITAAVQAPPLAGRLLGSRATAHLGTIAATAAGVGSSREPACSRYVDWYRPSR